jgi:hypothetical protein
MDEDTLKICIKELVGIKKGLNILADKKIMETGKGDFFLDGQVLGLNTAIAALEDLGREENDLCGEVKIMGSEIEYFPDVLKAWKEGKAIQCWDGEGWLDWNHSSDSPHVSGLSPWRIKPSETKQ